MNGENPQDIAEEGTDQEDMQIQENEDLQFSGTIDIDDDVIPEDLQGLVPTYVMYRNNRTDIPTNEFMPGDLITIVIENTGSHKKTEVRMEDSKDQPRYHAVSGGSYHNHTTRIQRTTMYGDWKFIAKVPFDQDESFLEMVIPFKISEFVADPPPLEAEIELEVEFMEGIVPEPIQFEEEITVTAEIETAVNEIEVTAEVPIIENAFQEIYNFAISNEIRIPVTEIKGVGPAFERKMALEKIFFMHDLLSFTEDELSEKLKTQGHRVQKWFTFIEEVLGDPNHSLVQKYQKPTEAKITTLTKTKKPPKKKKSPKPSTLPGIGPATEKKFINAGFPDVESIAQSSIQEIVEKIGVTEKKAEKWFTAAVESVGESETGETETKVLEVSKAGDKPSVIKGVGPAIEKKLIAAGMETVEKIVEGGIEPLTDVLGLNKASKLLENAKLYLNS